MKRCSKCGTKNKPDANYCNHCGKELDENSSLGTHSEDNEDVNEARTKEWGGDKKKRTTGTEVWEGDESQLKRPPNENKLRSPLDLTNIKIGDGVYDPPISEDCSKERKNNAETEGWEISYSETPDDHLMLRAKLRLEGKFTNDEPIKVRFDWFRDDSDEPYDKTISTIPKPKSEGHDYWNYYWLKRYRWNVKPGLIRCKIHAPESYYLKGYANIYFLVKE